MQAAPRSHFLSAWGTDAPLRGDLIQEAVRALARSSRRCRVLVPSGPGPMPPCPTCQRPAIKRDGRDPRGRQCFAGRACGRDFTARSGSAFAGYRWPAEVILRAVRWALSHPL
jgi:hypothetical protein